MSATRSGAACAARTVRWQLRNPNALRAHPHARPGGAYFGNTAQTYPVLLRLDRTGRHLRQASLELDYACQSATQRGFANETTPAARVSRTGAFTGNDRYASTLGPGLTGHWVSTVRGRVRGDRIAGTWKVDLTITRADGSMADFCTSGHVAFKAAR